MQGLALAPERDQPVLPELGEVLRQGRLAEVDPHGKARHVHLAAGDEQAQDEKALFVAKKAKQARRIAGLVLQAHQFIRRHGVHRLESRVGDQAYLVVSNITFATCRTRSRSLPSISGVSEDMTG